jgi:glycosyltransferase involved in cell wall biosynthesis
MFKKVWVPGELQAAYARRLGYDEVAYNFYAPDISYFTSFANKTTVPHRFIFIGRYLTHKGIFDLWEAFIDIKKQHENDWELWCLGTGDKFNERIEHPSIKHFGFIQPNELDEYLKNTGVYVLPSHFEPWGVAVHEMAAAGFPLLLSNAVGSHRTFLKNDNGFLFASTYKDSLKEAMLKVIKTSDEELLKMGKRSVVYANQITQDIWVNTLLKF